MTKRILIVDDDPDIREVVALALEQENFEPITAEDGEQALARLDDEPDLILLDIMLPDIEGRELFRQIQQVRDIPTIFVSRKSDDIDRILGLELGADGYIAKPFNPREVAARVKAVLRRIRKASEASETDAPADPGDDASKQFGKLRLDPVERRVFWDDREVELTRTQFDLIAAMLSYPKKVYTRGDLIQKVYDDTIVSERTIDSHVRRIRKAFEAVDGEPIATVHGTGFRLKKS